MMYMLTFNEPTRFIARKDFINMTSFL